MAYLKLFLTSLALLLITTDSATAWTGKVVGVSDGDTIKVLSQGKQVKVRLYGIDTPEKKQAFGKKAKAATAKLVAGKSMRDRSECQKDKRGSSVGLASIFGGPSKY